MGDMAAAENSGIVAGGGGRDKLYVVNRKCMKIVN